MKKKKKSLIWKITSPSNSNSNSYLVGTMHVRDAKAFVRLEDMYQCIDATQVFATEFNLEEANHELTANRLDLKEGESLENLLGEKKYQKIKKIIRKGFGLDISFFNQSIPFLLINILTEKILSDDMQSSLDATLWEYAKQQEKTTIGIETLGEQMEILEHIPLSYQIKQLKDLAKNIAKFKKQIIKTTELYQEEDIQKLYKKVNKSLGSLKKLMLVDRNILMAERLSKIVEETSICFAVGAGHLSGKKGLIKLLKNKGYQLKPI